jgi:hypothetical protein
MIDCRASQSNICNIELNRLDINRLAGNAVAAVSSPVPLLLTLE